MSHICRINRKHKFANENAKLAHEKKCPDLPKSKFKICIYNPKHLIPKDKYENHIHNLCSNKPEKIQILKNENIDDITKNNNTNQKIEWNINEEENNINNNEKKISDKKVIENYEYDEEDRIFWEAYKN